MGVTVVSSSCRSWHSESGARSCCYQVVIRMCFRWKEVNGWGKENIIVLNVNHQLRP